MVYNPPILDLAGEESFCFANTLLKSGAPFYETLSVFLSVNTHLFFFLFFLSIFLNISFDI